MAEEKPAPEETPNPAEAEVKSEPATEPADTGVSDGSDKMATKFKDVDKKDDEDREDEMWRGGYCPKAMLGEWILCGLATAGLIGGFIATGFSYWQVFFGAIALIWIIEGLRLAYRKLNVRYRLTSQRFIHETGVLSRVTDRIEVIEIDDISFKQGPIERIVGVGTIIIQSKDPSHGNLILPGIENVEEIYHKLDTARRTERTNRGLHITNL